MYGRYSAPTVPTSPFFSEPGPTTKPHEAAIELQQGGHTSMQQIPLSQGQVALVDDADYPLLSEHRWCYRPERNDRQGYAVRHVKADGKYRTCYLHRVILPAPPEHETIFLNHDRLDCRRSNLKVVTKEEARQHHRVRSDSKSGVKGVRYSPESETWSAY